VALFIATIFTAHALLPHGSTSPNTPGMDFIAFYTAGTFVDEGRADKLYDLAAMQQFQHELAQRSGLSLGQGYGPWWNPPFHALVFAPLSMLSYQQALVVWIALNLACAAAGAVLLCRMLPPKTSWKTWALAPVLMVLSTPFIFAISHGQNTCISLLILSIAVLLWRQKRGIAAGMVGGLLLYKPQLAAALAVVMMLDVGGRCALGYAITGAGLLLLNLAALPGTLSDFVHRMPVNLHLVQTHSVYLWERHVTFTAFWRLLLQGHHTGESATAVRLLATICMAGFGSLLAVAILRLRRSGRGSVASWQRDRLISATILCSPLLMPFYFDYDLLLLAIPAVLLAAERMQREPGAEIPAIDRAQLIVWPVFYVWLMLNPDVGERTRLILAVPLLAALAGLSIARLNSRREVVHKQLRPAVPKLAVAA